MKRSWVLWILGLVMCGGCFAFVLAAGALGPEGVGSEEWQRTFHPDAGVDSGNDR